MPDTAAIPAAGVVRGMPMSEYHGIPALSAGGIWQLVDEAPAKYWIRSPYNPDYQTERSTAFDIGTAAHLAVLEPATLAEKIVEVDADDFRTKAAQRARDYAYEAGKTPLLPKQLATVHAIAAAIEAHPIAREAFKGGEAEVTFRWNDEATGVPCKCRVDYLPAHRRYLVDLKSAASANPREWIKNAARLGYFARAAFYIDGVTQAVGRDELGVPDDYFFVNIEKEFPHLISVCTFEAKALEFGRMINRRGIDLFEQCMRTQDWHGYREPGANRDRAFRVSLPVWAEYALADRDQAGEFRSRKVTAADVKRAAKLYAPEMEP